MRGVMEYTGEIPICLEVKEGKPLVKFLNEKSEQANKIDIYICSVNDCGYVEFYSHNDTLHNLKRGTGRSYFQSPFLAFQKPLIISIEN